MRKTMRNVPACACLCLSILLLSGFGLQAAEPARWAILVSGISGDPALQKDFLKQILDLRTELVGPLDFQSDHVFVLFDDPSKDPSHIQYKSTREELERVCREIAGKAGKEDLVFVFLTGHGSYDQSTYKLNLVGPDPTAVELAEMLYAIPADVSVVVNATTASGGSLAALSQRGKVVVSATKSGTERNRSHFGRYFIDALQDNNGDTDKNGRVSILEAFNYATKKVEEYYSSEASLQTEHAVLDDDGDGKGHDKPGPDNGDGFLAGTTYLDAGVPLISRGDLTPEELELAREAQSLEKQIEALKYQKAEMDATEYEKKLEALFLRLARINEKLRKK